MPDPSRSTATRITTRHDVRKPHVHHVPKRPRVTHFTTHSILRPHVLASECLKHWQTPYGLQFRLKLLSVAKNPDHVITTMLASLEEQSRKNYVVGLLRFNQYCDAVGTDGAQSMPATDQLCLLS